MFENVCNLELSQIYPPKYFTEYGRQTLWAMKPLDSSPSELHLSTLPYPKDLITPQHIRAPKGRRKNIILS